MPDRATPSSSGVALIAGRYELVREVGTEDNAVVWDGFDAALQRRVRVWLLRQEAVDNPAAVERFWQNARSAARSSTVTGERVLDGGTDPETGRVFVVREWSQAPDTSHGATVVMQLPERRSRLRDSSTIKAGRTIGLLGLIAVTAIGLLAVRSGVQGWLVWVNEPVGQVSRRFLSPAAATPPAVGAQPGQAAPTPAGPPPTVAANAGRTATAPAVAAARATATLLPIAGAARRVVNTDGRGVALRASPGGDRLPAKGYDEGATVTAFESSGEWTHIRGADGREGWVLSVTLAP